MSTMYDQIRQCSHNRSFDNKAHRGNDARGKVWSIEFMQQRGWTPLLNPEEANTSGKCLEYYDAVFKKDDTEVKVDAEVREGHWPNGRYHIGYDDISQPSRKFREDYDSVGLLMSFSDDGTGVYVTDKEKAKVAMQNDDPRIQIVEKWAEGEKEKFVHISKSAQGDLFHYFSKRDDGKWEHRNT